MDLYVMRHGEALSKQEAGVATDEERLLSPRGVEDVLRVARQWERLDYRPDRILTSPLARARQTAELIAKRLQCEDRLEALTALHPEQDPPSFLTALPRFKEARLIVAVSHQPLLGQLITQLAFGRPLDGVGLKPAGVAWLRLPDFPRSTEGLLMGLWNPEE